jgi:hypothetical protein
MTKSLRFTLDPRCGTISTAQNPRNGIYATTIVSAVTAQREDYPNLDRDSGPCYLVFIKYTTSIQLGIWEAKEEVVVWASLEAREWKGSSGTVLPPLRK